MPPPDVHPDLRDPHTVEATDTYHPTDRVWVYRDGVWRAGLVEAASRRAVTVTYRLQGIRSTGVDTLTAAYVRIRHEADPFLDRLADVPAIRPAVAS